MLLKAYVKASLVADAVKARLAALRDDENGAGLIEYALLAALIAVVSIASMKTLQTAIATLFGKIGTALGAA